MSLENAAEQLRLLTEKQRYVRDVY
jgi:sulfite reductase alpha subunit-like flavoprotein